MGFECFVASLMAIIAHCAPLRQQWRRRHQSQQRGPPGNEQTRCKDADKKTLRAFVVDFTGRIIGCDGIRSDRTESDRIGSDRI